MLGEKIKNLRERNGYSQERLAEQLGVSRQAVSKWETGLSRPDMGNLIALAKLFHISFDELIGNGEADQKATPSVGEMPFDSETSKISENPQNIPEGSSQVRRRSAAKKKKYWRKSRIFFTAGCMLVLLICGYLYFCHYDTKGTVNPDSGKTGLGKTDTDDTDPGILETGGRETRGSETGEMGLGEADPGNTGIGRPTAEDPEDTNMDQPQDSLNTVDSVQFQTVVQNFANAYFRSDPEEAARYSVIAEDEIEVYPEDIAEDLAYMVLKWNPEDLSDQPVRVQYQWQVKGSDSADYLGLEVMKINDEWKVTLCYLEK